MVGSFDRSRSTLAANSSSDSSERTTFRFALRRRRSRPRRASTPTQRSSRGHSAAMRTATAHARSAIQTALTPAILPATRLILVHRVLLLACLAALAFPGLARAGEQTLTLHSYNPIILGPYGVIQ